MYYSIVQTVSEQLQYAVNEDNTTWGTVSAIFSSILPKTNDKLLVLEDYDLSSLSIKIRGFILSAYLEIFPTVSGKLETNTVGQTESKRSSKSKLKKPYDSFAAHYVI